MGKNHGSSHHRTKHKAPPPPPPPSIAPSPNAPLPSPSPEGPPAPSPETPPPAPSIEAPPPPPAPKHKPPPPAPGLPSNVFDVLDFGAKGDGTSDDAKAFQAAWAAACKVEASKIMVPSEYTFLVGPISFSGPNCQPNIIFQLDGIIIAPTSSKAWGSGLLKWLEFTKLRGITIQGSGTIEGRGAVWWQESPYSDTTDNESKHLISLNDNIEASPISNSLDGKMPRIRPTALRFYGSFNVTVTGITIQNSPQCHLKFDNCIGVSVFNISISSPGDSPNTDGIHLQNSRDVLIRSSNLACGDDCVSIQTGCTNVYIHNVNCGPGHGISIGGLGKDKTKACVSNITVRDISMHNTMTGVRIKTWQGGSGSVQGILFSNIQVSEVKIPIVIDQYYCDHDKCKNQTSAVALSEITYEKIKGTYTVQPVYLACSDSLPCADVTVTDIKLNPIQEHYRMYDAFCWQTFGELNSPIEPPIDCLQDAQMGRWSSCQYAYWLSTAQMGGCLGGQT
ncbi:pectin lyase-like superfamily protein [Actinidia rufa]|uniref:Pectin lyase-like superfamily protein n=1 Tax=Actinidia rufa TaxID=165716 RepID=A0A7J0EYQ1_9ERIC|nr:pectin lyase-like superfamily protein [Actinidia rufa]